MKKFFLFALGAIILSSANTFAYTSTDCRIADDLADEDIIRDYDGDCREYRLDDRIMRQEAAGIALTVADSCDTIRSIPSTNYRCENVFRDVSSRSPNTWACRVAETLADNDIVSDSRGYFRPTRYVTKAEALGMLMDAADIDFRDESYSRGSFVY